MSVDVLVLSLGTTRGLQVADAQLVELIRRAGASVAATSVRIGLGDRLRRGYPANDLVEALAARRALDGALARERPRAVIFSTTTASLLGGVPPEIPVGIWLDSPACLNRPGRPNAVLHALERRAMARARVILPWSAPALEALPAGVGRALVVSPPIKLGPAPAPEREPVVVAYTPDPKAKDLELLCRSWEHYVALAREPGSRTGARLRLTGIEPGWAREFLRRRGITTLPPCFELVGMLDRRGFRRELEHAAAFLSAARWEDFGQAPLEALAAGAALVCAPGGGPFPALALARQLEPRFVAATRSPDLLARALALALDAGDLRAYRARARAAVADLTADAVLTRLRDEVLPLLLGA
ncbi:MAG TPA: glycosyltransferase [Solirubrobacteraceae bacterium]|nr:glycosyltransferase [Solirubrobacteraceae bacterium]